MKSNTQPALHLRKLTESATGSAQGTLDSRKLGLGEDGIYFDHRGDCRDSALHKTCAGRWRGVVSLGFDADGKRLRRKVSGQTKAEVKDKLKALHPELDAGLRTAQG